MFFSQQEHRNPFYRVLHFLCCVLYYVSAHLIWIVILVPLHVILLAARLVACLVAWAKYGNQFRSLAGKDFFGAIDYPYSKECNMFFFILETNGEAVDLAALQNRVWERLLNVTDPRTGDFLHWKLRSRLEYIMGCLFWIRNSSFHTPRHCSKYDGTALECLNAIRASKRKTEYQTFKVRDNLWGIHICSDGILINVHHGIGDAIASLQVFLPAISDEPLETPAPVRSATWFQSYCALLDIPWYIARRMIPEQRNCLADPDNLKHTQEQTCSVMEPMEFSRIKTIATANRVTVNELVLSCSSTALHRYCQFLHDSGMCKNCSKVSAENPCDSLVIPLSVVVSLHQFSPTDLTNAVGAVSIPSIPLQGDPPQRLQAVREGCERKVKNASSIWTCYVLRKVGDIMPTWSVDWIPRRFFTVEISNLLGPTRTFSVLGARVETIIPVALEPLSAMKLSWMRCYNGKFTLSSAMERDVCPDDKHAEILFQYFRDELNELEDHINIFPSIDDTYFRPQLRSSILIPTIMVRQCKYVLPECIWHQLERRRRAISTHHDDSPIQGHPRAPPQKETLTPSDIAHLLHSKLTPAYPPRRRRRQEHAYDTRLLVEVNGGQDVKRVTGIYRDFMNSPEYSVFLIQVLNPLKTYPILLQPRQLPGQRTAKKDAKRKLAVQMSERGFSENSRPNKQKLDQHDAESQEES
ncbi:unnamed protein product [Cyprideis torosa]|uniref:Uncharacterized protein n=1 Tax=Cyprideis torosa TaxID=163714 RepID=A0A7R8W4Q8_9CRUS|nr:unnamed protein product [Cyprideis torosa]CAG0884316.1 unnamed protein product [Cyprideis torosa]